MRIRRMDCAVNPYRVPAKSAEADGRLQRRDLAIFYVTLFVWAISALRAILGAMHHEHANADLALAYVLAVAIPWLARRAM